MRILYALALPVTSLLATPALMVRLPAALAVLALVIGPAVVDSTPAYGATIPTGAQSLESVNYPRRYVRHLNFLGQLDPVTPGSSAQTRQDATFCAVDGAAPGSVSLVSYNYPTRRIRHRDFSLWVEPYQDTALFRADSSFHIRAVRIIVPTL